jgi:diguanylate cyclase (GGDEF)-like protein/PAS domain S-box-containing protein
MTPIKNQKILHHEFVHNDPLHQFFDEIESISVQGYDADRKVIYWNPGSELLYGYSKEEALGKKLEELIIPSVMHEAVILGHYNWIDANKEIRASEMTLHNKNGQDVHVFSSHVMFTNQHEEKQMYCIDVNLADARQAQEQVVFKEHMLKTVLEATPDVFFLMQENGIVIDYYAGNNKLVCTSKNFLGRMIKDILPPEVATLYMSNMAKILNQKGTLTFEYELAMPEGIFHFEARMSHLRNYKQIVTIVRNITEQYQSNEIIRQHAYYDALTSLPNRLLSLEHLLKMLNTAIESPQKTSVLFLDIDDFKKVNDSLGHEVGDKLLIESANRLLKVTGKNDTIGRLGGDEFIILSQDLPDQNSVLNLVNDILNEFKQPFILISEN